MSSKTPVTGADLQMDWDALQAEAEEARLPVPRVPWNFVPATVEDVTFLVAAVQQIRAGIAHRAAQVAEMNAVADRLADALAERYRTAARHIIGRELAGGKSKSLQLVTGVSDKPTRVGFRAVRERLDIIDAWAALEWARANCPDAVKVSETVFKTPLAEYVKRTGEVPDGCAYEAGGTDEFYGL